VIDRHRHVLGWSRVDTHADEGEVVDGLFPVLRPVGRFERLGQR